MASDLMFKLKPKKKAAIEAALLEEFTRFPVAQAQVARIVKSANVSRGAFYNYFEDLPDAYRYLYNIALIKIHAPIKTEKPLDFVEETRKFIESTSNSEYYALMQMHFKYNEAYVKNAVVKIEANSELQWASKTLTHATIREALLDPTSAEQRLQRLKVILKKLEESICS